MTKGKGTKKGGAKQDNLNEIDNEPISTSPTHEELAEESSFQEFPTEPTQIDILAAINSLSKKVDTRLADISKSIGSLAETVKATQGRVHEVEQTTVDHEARLQDIEKQCPTFKNDNKTLKARLEMLELNSRRQNIRICGIHEDTEKGKPTEFVSELIQALLGSERFKTAILIDRAHRSQATKPAKGGLPRPFIVRLHYPQTRDLILKLANQKFLLNFNGARVAFYPDLTLEVRNQRKEYDEVRNKCRAANIRYGFLFPSTCTFDNPKEADLFLTSKLPG
jgi:hypothetical protein